MAEIRVIEVTCCGNCPYLRTSPYSSGYWVLCGKNENEIAPSDIDAIDPRCPLPTKEEPNA